MPYFPHFGFLALGGNYALPYSLISHLKKSERMHSYLVIICKSQFLLVR
jgi:hypothetical protein